MPGIALVSRHKPLVDPAAIVLSDKHTKHAHVISVEVVVKAQTAGAASTEIVTFQDQSARVTDKYDCQRQWWFQRDASGSTGEGSFGFEVFVGNEYWCMLKFQKVS